MPHTPKAPEDPNATRDGQRALAEAMKKLSAEGYGEYTEGTAS